MNEFYSYLSNDDKEIMALETACDIEIEKQMLAYEYVTKIHDIRILQSDLKVLNESGTYEDLESFYSEAGKEATEKKKGIIASIIEAISNFITKMITGIKNMFKGKSEAKIESDINSGKIKTVKCPDPKKASGIFSKASNEIKKIFRPGAAIDEDAGNRAETIAKTAAASIAALSVVGTSATVAWKAHKDQCSMLEELKRMVDAVKQKLPSGDGAPKAARGLQDVTKGIGGFIRKITPAFLQNFDGPDYHDPEAGDEESDVTVNVRGKNIDDPSRTNAGRKDQNGKSRKEEGKATEYNKPLKAENNFNSDENFGESVNEIENDISFMESEELNETMDELGELFASL